MKMAKTLQMLSVGALLTAGLSGCAHWTKEGQELDQKVSALPTTPTNKELAEKSNQAIASANLSASQKASLEKIRADLHVQGAALMSQNQKLRSVLIDEMAKSDYDPSQVDLIKKRIRKNEEDRLALLFMSVEKTNRVLGRETSQNHRIMNEMFENPVEPPLRDMQ